MLELNTNHCIKEIEDLKDLVIATYVIIDDIYQKVTPTHIRNRRNINDSILSDSEIITISIIGEVLTIDSEKAWLGFCKKNMRDLFPRFCHRTRFNRVRRSLHAVIEEIRKELSSITELLTVSQSLYASLEELGSIKPLGAMELPMVNVLQRRKLIWDSNFIC